MNRVQKILEGANIKLSGTVREINGTVFRMRFWPGRKWIWQR